MRPRTPRRPLAALLWTAATLAAWGGSGCASASEEERLALDVYLHNAQSYMDGGHWEQALDQFRQGLAVEPSNRKALLGEATCLSYVGAGSTPRAGRAIEEAEERIAALDASDYGENGWKVDLIRGQIHARLADLWGMKIGLLESRSEREEPGAAAELRAAREAREGHEEVAANSFRAVLAREGAPMARNNLVALYYLGRQAALRSTTNEGYDRALDYFRRFEDEVEKSKRLWREMKKREPDLAAVYEAKLRSAERQETELRDLVANIHFKRREHEASIQELEKVIALDPYRAAAFFNKGRNEEELGRYGAAADDFRRFLKVTDLPPTSSMVVEAAERMARCEEQVRVRMSQ